MEFIDRVEELRRLRRLGSAKAGFCVVYGRRRIGKSCLLTRWCKENGGVYLVGDTSSASVQRAYFAEGAHEDGRKAPERNQHRGCVPREGGGCRCGFSDDAAHGGDGED